MKTLISIGLVLALLSVMPMFSQKASPTGKSATMGRTLSMRSDIPAKLLYSTAKFKHSKLQKYLFHRSQELYDLNKTDETALYNPPKGFDRLSLWGRLRSYLQKESRTLGLADNMKSAWVRHYGSGLAPGFDQVVAMAVDGSGNIYVIGLSSGQPFGADYLTIKYDASGKQLWTARYDGSDEGDDSPSAIAVDGIGNVYVTGYSYNSTKGLDYATIKYNTSGVKQWIALYSGPADNLDAASAIAVDGAGSVYVTGGSVGASANVDYATIKYNRNGIQEWVVRYNGLENVDDEAVAIMVDGAGNIYVSGTSGGSGTGKDYATVKYNSSGTEQWVARYNNVQVNADDEAVAMDVTFSGEVYVTGTSAGVDTKHDYVTVKYSSAGTEQWVKRYNGTGSADDEAVAIARDAAGYVYVTGASAGAGTSDDYATVKYSSTGVEQWVARYDGPTNSSDQPTAIAIDSLTIYVTGKSTGSDTESDYATVKYNSDGAQQWVVRYDGPASSDNAAKDIAVDRAGNIYVTGTSTDPLSREDYATIKYNRAGFRWWIKYYNNPENSVDFAADMAVDASGNIYVAGGGMGPDTSYYFVTAKYSSNGILQWATHYADPPFHEDEHAAAIVVDDAGNIYITGEDFGPGMNFDIVTIKYDPNGNRLWVASYNGPGNGDDIPVGIALDSLRNVYVTGESYGSGTEVDYVTLKYTTNGTPQWNTRYNGPANSDDVPAAIATDRAGNVYVTGSSHGTGTGTDYATIKYNSGGMRQWVGRYDGSANSDDEASAIAVDGSQNVYVTGSSNGAGTEEDYVTVKYSPSGAELWVARQDGSASGYDAATAMTVDGSSNVYVTGTSESSDSSSDYVTIKYSPANGSVQWIASYSGSEYSPGEWVFPTDIPTAITVDGAGNVYVTGFSGMIAFVIPIGDYATVKYTSSGTEAWVARYDGPGIFVTDFPFAMALDDSANVYVSGGSTSLFGGWSAMTTVKYNQGTTSVEEQKTTPPQCYWLSQNYPNPFNPSTTVRYRLPKTSIVTLKVFNVSGQEVATLVKGLRNAGLHEVQFDASRLPSGVYIYRLETGGFSQSRKLLLLR